MNELMRREMLSQSAMLRDGLKDMRRQAQQLVLPAIDRVVLTGSGDSYIAAMAVEYAWQRRSRAAVWATPAAAAARFGHGRMDGLVVVVSVSGEVSRTIEAAEVGVNAGATVIAVTSAADSTLARASTATIVMPSPITRSTPHTRDYTATLLALLTLLERTAGTRITELDTWPDLIDPVLQRAADWAERELPGHAENTIFLGMGPDRGTAAYGALKLWEAGGLSAYWDDLEEFAHGSQLLVRPGDDAVVFAAGKGAARAAEMLPGIIKMGLRPHVISDGFQLADASCIMLPRLSADLVSLVACLPIQAMTYAVAQRNQLDVTDPVGRVSTAAAYDECHVEWTKRSVVDASQGA